MKAIINTAYIHNFYNSTEHIKTVVCCGLGTGTGRVPYSESARQMVLALKNFTYSDSGIKTWTEADKIQSEIIYGGNSPYTSIFKRASQMVTNL
jgi:O-acetyl-ADP-ribose deacetylase (regulator of RNase III)